MTPSTAQVTDIDVARAIFQAFADAGTAAPGELLHTGATWYHRNNDRLGGIHQGTDAIMTYLAQSAHLTGGTLRAAPQSFLADGAGRVCVLVRVSGTRPDGRWSGNPQIVLVTPGGGRVRSIGQFAGDPAAVTAFWA